MATAVVSMLIPNAVWQTHSLFYLHCEKCCWMAHKIFAAMAPKALIWGYRCSAVVLSRRPILLCGNEVGFVPTDTAADNRSRRRRSRAVVFTLQVVITYMYINLNLSGLPCLASSPSVAPSAALTRTTYRLYDTSCHGPLNLTDLEGCVRARSRIRIVALRQLLARMFCWNWV